MEIRLPRIPLKLLNDSTSNLGNLYRVSKTGAVEITLTKPEDLRLPLQPTEERRVDYSSSVSTILISLRVNFPCLVLSPFPNIHSQSPVQFG